MKEWERKHIEYRPPLEPSKDLLGKGAEIGEQAIRNELDRIPAVMQESLLKYPAKVLEELEEVEEQAKQLLNELSACLIGDEKGGVVFEDYRKSKEKAPEELTPKDRENVFAYEWNHNLDLNGKPQVEAFSKGYEALKEAEYFKEFISNMSGKTPKDSVEALKEKQTKKRLNVIQDLIDGNMKQNDVAVKQIANETKLSYILEERSHAIGESLEELRTVLTKGALEVTGYEPEAFVYELGKSGKDNVEKLNKIQEKAHKGNAYRMVSNKSLAQNNTGVRTYKTVIDDVKSAQDELYEVNSVNQWMMELDDEFFESHHAMNYLLEDTVEMLKVATQGVESVLVDLEKMNKTAEFVEHDYIRTLEDKCRNKQTRDILNKMIEHYDFNNNSPEEAKKFVQKFKMNQSKNICG